MIFDILFLKTNDFPNKKSNIFDILFLKTIDFPNKKSNILYLIVFIY